MTTQRPLVWHTIDHPHLAPHTYATFKIPEHKNIPATQETYAVIVSMSKNTRSLSIGLALAQPGFPRYHIREWVSGTIEDGKKIAAKHIKFHYDAIPTLE